MQAKSGVQRAGIVVLLVLSAFPVGGTSRTALQRTHSRQPAQAQADAARGLPSVVQPSSSQRKQINLNLQVHAQPEQAAPSGARDAQLRIPRILHHADMRGYASYLNGTQQTPPVNRKGWRDSCLLQHPNWEHKFWDDASALALITEHYSWFLPTWKAYNREIARADVIRVFALYHNGGLYLDLDVQCLTNVMPFLRGYDVVLQGSTEEWDKGTINCAMASVPQHPLWMAYARLLPETQKENSNFAATGPAALAKAVAMHYHLPEPIPPGVHRNQDDASLLKVYPVGEWYVPCMGNGTCNGELVKKLIVGDTFPGLAGYHRFQGTWYSAPHEDAWLSVLT